MKKSSLDKAKPTITEFFDNLAYSVFRRYELYSIFNAQKEIWKIAQSIRESMFLSYLIERLFLTEIKFKFPQRNEIIYTWRKSSVYEIALKVHRNSFLSNITAAELHGLTEASLNQIYVCSELPNIGSLPSEIDQDSIKRAFQNRPRITKNLSTYKNKKIYRLFTKNHKGLGVSQITTSGGIKFPITDVERTLIDIAVRPFYTDSSKILEIYKNAGSKCQGEKILTYLRKMQFGYPYHQSIGFLMEQSRAFPIALIRKFHEMKKPFDFYLTYKMINPKYSSEWRLFYPNDF